MAKTIIGVMGPGANPKEIDLKYAFELGQQIAQNGWVLLTGGRDAGVMHAASKGAAEENGLIIGILPGETRSGMSPFVNMPVVTGMGSARNNVNALTSDVIVACGTGIGTTSEIMLALKAGKPVILLNQADEAQRFLDSIASNHIHFAHTPGQAIEIIQSLL